VNATLEQRIKAALSSDATVDDLASLIVETAAVSFDRRLSADWWQVQRKAVPCGSDRRGAAEREAKALEKSRAAVAGAPRSSG
jgi:hypothetical protein